MAAAKDDRRSPAGPALTGDPGEFEERLAPGDVLLFDSMFLVSQLIKLADNRPVSHCALYLGDGAMAHCLHPDEECPTAVRRQPLAAFLELPQVRTATALRHRRVGRAPAGDRATGPTARTGLIDPVLEQAAEFVERPTSYANVHLLRLALPTILRAYRRYLQQTPWYTIQALATTISTAALRLPLDEVGRLRPSRGGKQGFTCSSFVYRCYLGGAGRADPVDRLLVDVTRPLHLETGRPHVPGPPQAVRDSLRTTPGPAPAATARDTVAPPAATGGPEGEYADLWRLSGLEEMLEPDELDRLLAEDGPAGVRYDRSLLDDPAAGSAPAALRLRLPGGRGGDDGPAVLTSIARKALDGYALRQWAGDPLLGPLDFAVTPRDLWSSPSFVPVAVLHRSPADLSSEEELEPKALRSEPG